jgi:multidrug efflux system membrane fusion protein
VNRIQTDAASARASVLASETAVRSAQLNLDYCSIKAPQSGRTGAVLVDSGNVVIANTTDLVIINQVAPIEVNFSVAEQYLGTVMEYMKQGTLKVLATPEGQKRAAEGEVVFLNNQVNRAAGTIELKGLFPNQERTLWPGQFTNVEVWLTTETDRIVTPVRAVQTGQDGQFVYVITDDQIAAMVPVKLSRTAGDDAVIEQGLKGGERVVIDGQGQLTDGAKVDVKSSIEAVLKPDKAPPPAKGKAKA